MQPGYIYLIDAEGTDRYKIGLTTRTPEERLKELNGKQSPFPLRLKYFVKVVDVRQAESLVHQECKRYHYHNEWFQFPGDSIGVAIASMKKAGTLKSSKQNPDQQPDNHNSLTIAIRRAIPLGIALGTVIFFSWLMASHLYQPKYNLCMVNQGGAACDRLRGK